MARKPFSDARKTAHYLGLLLLISGFLCFGSVFVSAARHFGDFSNFEKRSRSEITRSLVGMGMMIAGAFLSVYGRMGAAGSGIILDPEKARKDVEPWSRMGGGVLRDALDEAGILPDSSKPMDRLPFDEQLRRLHKLRAEGLVSEQEFEATKKKILESA